MKLTKRPASEDEVVEPTYENDPDVVQTSLAALEETIGEMIPVYLEWTQANTDPTSYKQMSPSYKPISTMIRVDVPRQYVLEYNKDDGVTVLTPEGSAYIMRRIAVAITRIQSKP